MILNKMITVVLAALVMLSFSLGSKAAVSQKTKKKQTRKTLQVYSAYEAEDADRDQPDMMVPAAPLSEIKETKTASVSPSVIHVANPYFTVPTKQTNLIAARLQVVEAILIESGRAYDYRSHTTQELKNILREIRTQKLIDQRLAE